MDHVEHLFRLLSKKEKRFNCQCHTTFLKGILHQFNTWRSGHKQYLQLYNIFLYSGEALKSVCVKFNPNGKTKKPSTNRTATLESCPGVN